MMCCGQWKRVAAILTAVYLDAHFLQTQPTPAALHETDNAFALKVSLRGLISHRIARCWELWGCFDTCSIWLASSVHPRSDSIASLLRLQNAKKTERTHHRADTHHSSHSSCFLCILKMLCKHETILSIYRYSSTRHTLIAVVCLKDALRQFSERIFPKWFI
uniref:Putative secreted protein n=1 Tax=Ixodes ricinus TaxID=34613 RepID=A0A147BC80_IXORI